MNFQPRRGERNITAGNPPRSLAPPDGRGVRPYMSGARSSARADPRQRHERLSSWARPDPRGRLSPPRPCRLHAVVVRAAATLGGYPGDDLVWVGNVAGFAVDAIRRVQADAFAVRLRAIVHHFVDIGRAEILTRVAEFFEAAR